MDSKIYISAQLVHGHIEETELDLTDIPEFPVLSTKRLLGVVTRCIPEEDYAFLITNQFGIYDSYDPSQVVPLFLSKKEWHDAEHLRVGKWVTFELVRNERSVRHAAANARTFSPTSEDYEVYKNYLDTYDTIKGSIKGKHYNDLIPEKIHNLYGSYASFRSFVLENLYLRNCTVLIEWERLFSNMPPEEIATFTYDTTCVDVTLQMLVALYKHSNRGDIIKDESFISTLDSSFLNKEISYNFFEHLFKTEEDREDWIDYISKRNLPSDRIRSMLYVISLKHSLVQSVTDHEAFIVNIEENPKAVKILICKYLENKQNTELLGVISEFDDSSILDSLSQLEKSECIDYLFCISKDKAVEYLSDSRLSKFSFRQTLLSTDRGCQLLIEELYSRKSENVAEWDEVLTSSMEQQIPFSFDEKRVKPSAELRLCLYKHSYSVNWLLHPCVISYVSRIDDDDKIKSFFDCFYNEEDLNTWLKFLVGSTLSNRSLLSRLFLITNYPQLYILIEDKYEIIDHFNKSGVMEMKRFLNFAFKNLSDIDLTIACDSLNYEKLLCGLKKLPADTCFQLICRIPEETGIKIATSEHFKETDIFKNFIGEKWEKCKSEIQYVVFDLESDGNNISEFAFCSEDNLRSYEGEDQIRSLFRSLKKQPIIVGHNIKQWDLPILYKKGLILPEKTFIWDTLEMEILLNPCRYAYSLHTEHHAANDTKLTNDLFWNQLYRLSNDIQLVQSLHDVLPSGINDILKNLQFDYFSEYFAQTANLNQQFFQELRPLSENTISNLNKIARIPPQEPTLIIAPQNLWSRLAQYIPLSFPSENGTLKSIDIQKVKDKKIGNVIKHTILERFCAISKTPLVCNLAQYLRVEGDDHGKIAFTDDFLEPYIYTFNSHFDCIDVSGFECAEVLNKKYRHIYSIGSELADRIHKCKACSNKSFSDLLACGSKLPFTMAATNYAPVKDSEISKLGINMPKLSANVWVEREINGQFAFYLNYQYQSYRAQFLSHFDVKPQLVKCDFAGADYEHINLAQVSRIKTADMAMRVSNSTTQRSKYWLFQFALLNKIHLANPDKAIIYIVNEKDELDALEKYAISLGYYIPSLGSSFRKLEYIGKHDNGMIIITKKEFIDGIGAYRTDKAFCYVWDNMDIDRYMLMWNHLPFDDDLQENEDDERDDKVHHSTPRQVIHAAWPIYKHYCTLVMANNKDTQCFIIDPYFDDYDELAETCHAKSYRVNLWETNDLYTEALNISSNYFTDSRSKEKDIDIDTAMDMIRRMFIGNSSWKETQKEVLPHMIDKRGDCIISMPTGEGKSVCFQGPAIFKSSISHKLSLVVTPLRALMQDQVENLQKKGFVTNVDYLSGDRQRPEVENIYRKIRSGELALLFITPERFRVKSFINVLLQRMEMDEGLEYVIFDEAHCISQWGQEFRPDYRNALIKCKELREHYDFMFAMFSATVTSQVESDIRSFLPNIERLGQSADDYNPVRQHIGIHFDIVQHEDHARISEIVDFINSHNIDFSKSCMLIFCRTHRQCEETAEALNQLALAAESDSTLAECADKIGFYHADLDSDLRNDIYEQFKRVKGVEPIYILCATKAFGMGMDIPNVHYVVHYNPPAVLEDFLQEVGRAGRDDVMYKKAFDKGNQIPAVCLASVEDFQKLKELLVKSLLSWSDLTDCKDRIVDYIKRFQTIDKTKVEPVVVPFDVWIKNPDRINETTSTKLAFHWLEKIGYIKQRYFAQAHLDISIIRRNTDIEQYSRPVYRYLLDNTEEERCLVSIKDMCVALRMSTPRIMNQLIRLMKEGCIHINEKMICNIVTRRYCEVKYMIGKRKNIFALHIVFEGLRNLLSDCKENVVRRIGQNERSHIFNHLMDNVEYHLIIENGKKYMPWKNEDKNPPKMAVLLYDTFKKNIVCRMGAQMFSILYYLPMISYKIVQEEEEAICLIKVKNHLWDSYLNQLEEDCYKILGFVQEHSDPFNWAELLIDFEMTDYQKNKGFRYFEDVLSVLHHLSYIEHTPLIKNGIEILTTDNSEKIIEEGKEENSAMFNHRIDFDNQEQIKKIRLACMNVFSLVKKEDQSTYIRRYFQSKSYNDFLSLAGDYVPATSDILSEVSEEALKLEENKLANNIEQKKIYERPRNVNVNVLAGPGSGKTHVLTLRCARLIYREHVDPSHILVLAYNRAVVVELRNRLNTLFVKLGMSRIAHQLHVYTFHALAKKCLGNSLDSIPTDMWEMKFLEYLQLTPSDFIAHFRNIEFVLVDEFQDITNPRMKALFCIHEMYQRARFFTIGDINQSIYGFDRMPRNEWGHKISLSPEKYAMTLQPQPYYKEWSKVIAPQQLSMFTNYRSFQKILDKASKFITEGKVPKSAETLMKYEPQDPYVYEIDNRIERHRQWFVELPSIINWAIQENEEAATLDDKNETKFRHIDTIAVFFRKNNEVYRGFSKIKDLMPNGVRIRIQGESIGEMWREREIYFLIDILQKHPEQLIVLKNDKTANGIKAFLKQKMKVSPTWDTYLLDVVYCLVLNYIDSIRTDSDSHKWQDLADYIKDVAGHDDAGQVYKIYENYRNERILQEPTLNVILTTMHKVKGLEFDVVVTTPSFANLPLKLRREYQEGENLLIDDLADMEEERRLMYVSYTRAKKRLYIFNADREAALENNQIFITPNYDALRFTEVEPGIDKYFLNFSCQRKDFKEIDSYILNQVKKNDPVQICAYTDGDYYIIHNKRLVGRLAKNSTIVRRAKEDKIFKFSDFYVSSVFVWTLEDAIKHDEIYGTHFAEDWSETAKKQGYTYLVQIAGFGSPIK